MTQRMAAWVGLFLAGLALLGAEARAGDETPADLAAVLAGLPAPQAAHGFYVRASQRMHRGEQSVSLPLTLTAFPVREGGRPAWKLRQEIRRKPFSSVEEMVLGQDHRPIRGSARSKQGSLEQSLTWRLEGKQIRFEHKQPTGQTRAASAPVRGPVLCTGPGLVLFLRQLRPRTGTWDVSLLAPDFLLQLGLMPVKLHVQKKDHAGQAAYVGEVELPGAVRIVVALDPEDGALRAFDTHIAPAKTRAELVDIRDRGVAEVHNQSAAALEQQGQLRAALVEAEAARQGDRKESAYPLRIGALHRKLAKLAESEKEHFAHVLAAALATTEAARLMGDGLRSGRLASSSAASFRAMQASMYHLAGSELLEVLASDKQAAVLHGRKRSFVELEAARAFDAWAALETKDREQALRFAAETARGLARQDAGRDELTTRALWAVAALNYGRLSKLRPRDAQVWQQLGRAHYATGEVRGAILALEKCLAIQPKSPEARAYYGAALWRQGRKADARAQLAILERVGARRQAALLRRLSGMK